MYNNVNAYIKARLNYCKNHSKLVGFKELKNMVHFKENPNLAQFLSQSKYCLGGIFWLQQGIQTER
jgi:hypothetical protein